jgi:membrane-associated protease RseP (regulator of RpoE activity)
VEPVTSVSSSEPRHPRFPSNGSASTKHKDRYWLHALLLLLTLISTIYMGGRLVGRWAVYMEQGTWAYALDGFKFGFALLLFLSVHEFGHYFAARYHGVRTSLPYYIPLPFVGIGTLGAVIRIREPVPSMRKLFDIGSAGPLAGFIAAVAILVYALATLPPPSYIFDTGPGHESIQSYVEQYGQYPSEMLDRGRESVILVVGNTLLYSVMASFFSDVPPMYEMYHYPVLFAGWLGLFFTALNLLPIGQLDGGHIIYSLFGRKWHAMLARGFFLVLLISGSLGFFDEVVPMLSEVHPWFADGSWFLLALILFFYLNKVFDGDLKVIAPSIVGIILLIAVTQTIGPSLEEFAYSGWLIWCLLLVFLIKVDHPPVLYEQPLTGGQRALGILSIIVFVLCFSFKPLYVLNGPM